GSAPGSLADPLMLVVPFSIASSLSMTPRRLGCTITLESPRGFHGFLIWSCSTSGVETLTRERRLARAAGLRSAFTGADGNARLTATTGPILLVLLPIEGLTLLSLHSFLSVHMLLGVALIPPVALKMGSTFYRFFRYYTGSPIFRGERAAAARDADPDCAGPGRLDDRPVRKRRRADAARAPRLARLRDPQ